MHSVCLLLNASTINCFCSVAHCSTHAYRLYLPSAPFKRCDPVGAALPDFFLH